MNIDLVRGLWYLVAVPPTAFAASKGLNTGGLVTSIVCQIRCRNSARQPIGTTVQTCTISIPFRYPFHMWDEYRERFPISQYPKGLSVQWPSILGWIQPLGHTLHPGSGQESPQRFFPSTSLQHRPRYAKKNPNTMGVRTNHYGWGLPSQGVGRGQTLRCSTASLVAGSWRKDSGALSKPRRQQRTNQGLADLHAGKRLTSSPTRSIIRATFPRAIYSSCNRNTVR